MAMPDYREKGLVFGSQAIAKGIERVGVEIDVRWNKALLRPHLRPSTWINVGGGLVLALAPNYMRAAGTTFRKFGEVAGFHMVNKGWDYLEEYMAPAPPAAAREAAAREAARRAGTRYETPGGAPEFYPPLYGQRTGREPVLRDHVRYTLQT